MIDLDGMHPTSLDQSSSIELDARGTLTVDGKAIAYQNPVAVTARHRLKIHAELVAGGGGGGGASDNDLDSSKPGGGGKAGGYVFKEFVLEPGQYALTSGKGGAGGASGRGNHRGQHGTQGENSAIRHHPSGLKIAEDGETIGGLGGKADSSASSDRGGSGEHVHANGQILASGGHGGTWNANGEAGGFPGAGGGGHGGNSGDGPGHGGKGGDGRLRLWVLGRA